MMMAVYIDQLKNYGWRLGPSCHLIADTLDELHEFAGRLGMKRGWFQDEVGRPHYDLTARRRMVAVRLGASEVSGRELITILRSRYGKQ